MEGNVKFFNDEKKFGFIIGDDQKDYFVHITGLNDVTSLAIDERVSFDIEEGNKGLKAVNVDVL